MEKRTLRERVRAVESAQRSSISHPAPPIPASKKRKADTAVAASVEEQTETPGGAANSDNNNNDNNENSNSAHSNLPTPPATQAMSPQRKKAKLADAADDTTAAENNDNDNRNDNKNDHTIPILPTTQTLSTAPATIGTTVDNQPESGQLEETPQNASTDTSVDMNVDETIAAPVQPASIAAIQSASAPAHDIPDRPNADNVATQRPDDSNLGSLADLALQALQTNPLHHHPMRDKEWFSRDQASGDVVMENAEGSTSAEADTASTAAAIVALAASGEAPAVDAEAQVIVAPPFDDSMIDPELAAMGAAMDEELVMNGDVLDEELAMNENGAGNVFADEDGIDEELNDGVRGEDSGTTVPEGTTEGAEQTTAGPEEFAEGSGSEEQSKKGKKKAAPRKPRAKKDPKDPKEPKEKKERKTKEKKESNIQRAKPLAAPRNRWGRSQNDVDDDLKALLNTPEKAQAYLASKWIDAKELHRLEELKLITYKRGKWTEAERTAMRDHITSFQQANHLSDSQLLEIVLSKGRFDKRSEYPHFWAELAEKVPGRPVKYVVTAVQRMYDPRARKGPWTADEDAALLKAVEEHQNKWTTIADIVGRTVHDCRDRWKCELRDRDKRKKGAWTAEETNALREAVVKANTAAGLPELSSDTPWDEVVKLMDNSRSRTQCRKKWQDTMGYGKRVEPERKRGSRLDAVVLLNRLREMGIQHESDVEYSKVTLPEWDLTAAQVRRKWNHLKGSIPARDNLSFSELLNQIEANLKPDDWRKRKRGDARQTVAEELIMDEPETLGEGELGEGGLGEGELGEGGLGGGELGGSGLGGGELGESGLGEAGLGEHEVAESVVVS